jgi:hypothetical protein
MIQDCAANYGFNHRGLRLFSRNAIILLHASDAAGALNAPDGLKSNPCLPFL